MEYEELLEESSKENLPVKELPLKANKGRIVKGKIYIQSGLITKEKKCVLSEEIAHHKLTVGDITDQTKAENRKQEHIARMHSFDRLIGLRGIINAYDAHCTNIYEMASFLDVTEDCLNECIECYGSKYGEYTKVDNYIICFEPRLTIIKLI